MILRNNFSGRSALRPVLSSALGLLFLSALLLTSCEKVILEEKESEAVEERVQIYSRIDGNRYDLDGIYYVDSNIMLAWGSDRQSSWDGDVYYFIPRIKLSNGLSPMYSYFNSSLRGGIEDFGRDGNTWYMLVDHGYHSTVYLSDTLVKDTNLWTRKTFTDFEAKRVFRDLNQWVVCGEDLYDKPAIWGSIDNGVSWNKTVPVVEDSITAFYSYQRTQGNERLALVQYRTKTGTNQYFYRKAIARSTDNGNSYSYLLKDIDISHPVMHVFGDTVEVTSRSGPAGKHYTSYDGGQTWSSVHSAVLRTYITSMHQFHAGSENSGGMAEMYGNQILYFQSFNGLHNPKEVVAGHYAALNKSIYWLSKYGFIFRYKVSKQD